MKIFLQWDKHRLCIIIIIRGERLFGISPKVSSIHAGLECGVLKNKKMDLDMISLGPTIKNAHSPNEALERVTVEKLWTLVLAILKELK